MSLVNGCHDKEQIKTIDNIMVHLVGGNGWWQWRSCFFILPFMLPAQMPLVIHIFSAFTPEHRCFVPQCDNMTAPTYNVPWTKYALPDDQSSTDFLKKANHQDSCHMLKRIADGCSKASFGMELVPCKEFVYDRSIFEETITTKQDLVCSKQYKRKLIGTALMVGLALGSFAGGVISDKIGRKRTLLLAVLFLTPSIIAEGYAPNYFVFIVLRIVSSCCLPILWICKWTLISEYFSPKHRRHVSCTLEMSKPFNQSVLVILAYFIRHWTHLHLAVGIGCGLPLLFYPFVPESPRWLAENGREQEAKEHLLDMARTNKRTLSSEDEAHIEKVINNIGIQAQRPEEKKFSPLDLFQHGYLVTTLVLFMVWITINFAFFTLILNNARLSGDIFLNTFLGFFTTFPGALLLFFYMDKLGRRLVNSWTLGSLGLICMALSVIPKTATAGVLILYLLARGCCEVSFLMVWIHTCELYPTNLRSQALGTCSTIARVVGFLSPFMSTLAFLWKPLPMLVLGFPLVLSGILVWTILPETTGCDMPQTLAEGIELNRSTMHSHSTGEQRSKCVVISSHKDT